MREQFKPKTFTLTGCIASMLAALLLVHCGGSSSNPNKDVAEQPKIEAPPPVALKLTDNVFRIPGRPIVKVALDANSRDFWILAEQLTSKPKTGGGHGYVRDHPRFLYRGKMGEAPRLIPLPVKYNFITDIADCRDKNRLFVSVVENDESQDGLKHKILLVEINGLNETSIIDETTISLNVPTPPTVCYGPNADTLDVGRLVTKGGQVLFVGRNGSGERLLTEVDRACHFSHQLRPLAGYEPRSEDLHQVLLATIVAHGTNLASLAWARAPKASPPTCSCTPVIGFFANRR